MTFFQKLFKRTKTENTDLSDNEVEKIINDYGHAMEHLAPLPGGVADLSKLPHPKKKIKRAIARALQVSNDNQFNEMLKAGYMQLSDWQEGVGEKDIGINLVDIGNATPEAILEQQKAMEKWQKIIEREQVELAKELKSL